MAPHCIAFVLVLIGTSCAGASGIVLVTGASGQTGSLVYKRLRDTRGQDNQVRALVQNITKARQVLGCNKCDASEGIYVGDVTDVSSLAPAMDGVSELVIAVGVGEGTTNATLMREVEWLGVIHQVSALANTTSNSAAADRSTLKVALCSSMGTTIQNPQPYEGGPLLFWKLQAEAFLGSAGIQTAVVKPCGLVNTDTTSRSLIVGHNDEILLSPTAQSDNVLRSDVARMLVAALDWTTSSSNAGNLRFDFCSIKGKTTTDAELPALVENSMWPWSQTHK